MLDTVYVVEDDEAIRLSLAAMLECVNQPFQLFEDAETFLSFLEQSDEMLCGCIVLDVRMHGMSGMELQKKLARTRSILPIIFVTGHGDIPMAVEAMEQGAIAFLPKPYRDSQLLEKIYKGLEICRDRHINRQEFLSFREALSSLTSRGSEILEMIVAGKTTKAIAEELVISERTVDVHRSHLFKKLKTHSIADITRCYLGVRSRLF